MQIVASGGANYSTIMIGTTPAYAQVRNVRTALGNWFTDEQFASRAPVVVLGSTVAQAFGAVDPTGQNVRVTTSGGPAACFGSSA